MEALAEKYRDTVKFLVVYGYEIHPEEPEDIGQYRGDQKPVVQSLSMDQRREFARDFRALKHLKRQVLVDEFGEQSAAIRLLGSMDYTHPLAVIDRDGKIVFLKLWGDVAELERFLTELMGRDGHVTPQHKS
jgi:hypothetical protein